MRTFAKFVDIAVADMTYLKQIFFLDAGPALEGGYIPFSSDGKILLRTQSNVQTPERKSTHH